MEKTYNQKQYLRANPTRSRCRGCKSPVIWMRTVEGYSVAVDPFKIINRTPGVRVIGEDGIVMVNIEPKVGWKLHECQKATI